MGLFSPKKTIEVSSTVYNMAGEEANRPDFMKSTIFGAVMNPNEVFIGETLVNSYLSGPGMNQRAFFRYAVREDFPGLPTYSIAKALEVDPSVVAPFITVPGSPAGQELVIQDATLADGDYEVFAEIYMNENFPAEINTVWIAEYNAFDHTITIQRSGGATVNFPAGIYDPDGRFIIANHYFQIPAFAEAVVDGTLFTDVLAGSLPDTTGFTLNLTSNTGNVDYVQNQTRTITKVYSSGAPDDVTTDYPVINTSFNTILTEYEREVYNGGDGVSIDTTQTNTFISIWERRQVYADSSTNVVVNDLGGGATETVTTEITGDFLRTVYDHQTDTQETFFTKVEGGNKTFVYKIGTGNATLDALDIPVGSEVTAEFFPVIPVRLDNVSITDPIYTDLYAASEKMYKKATRRQKFSELVAEVEDNEDLSEIDYAYIQWGISLNTQENEAKKYMYSFWKNLIPLHGLPLDYMDTFIAGTAAYETAHSQEAAWIAAQGNPMDPLYGTVKPSTPSLGSPQIITLKFVTDHAELQDFDNRISFVFISETVSSGLAQVGAKRGDIWVVKETSIEWQSSKGVSTDVYEKQVIFNSMPFISIIYQTGVDEYRTLRIYGAVHENFIYGGKAVRISAEEALDETDESGFIIPLHYPSLKEAGLVSSTQLATANTYIVFNSYQVFTKRWYETFLGMLFIIVVVVAAAALIAPAAIGGIGGVFGTNAALGASFGLTGTAAVVAGAVTNALAAVLISTALSTASTAIFGEKWGALIGSLIGFAVTFGMAGGFNNLATLFQPSNILALSSALANGYQGFVQANIAEMNADLFTIGEEYEKEMDRIQDLMAELMGNDLAFNPMSLTDSTNGNGSLTGSYLPESLDEFIQRTTLTGSDIVELTLSLINDFSELSLTLPKT